MIIFYFILFAAVVYLLLPVGGVRPNKNRLSLFISLAIALVFFRKLTHLTHNLLCSWF
ncbi:hypothetical protein [Coxiella endosymbiont of Ornithodoros maritimus]|uniref:hypothetical protein n=1 Tax=Coxiella endosymbiont of Ornithodoros maritimus TaxID=1656172 RepID=UPI00226557DA|nr:hypothetical protein [Coxiella endosymbiont of Ornithodoros maritimus]